MVIGTLTLISVPIMAALSIVMAVLLTKVVYGAEPGNEKMLVVQGYIREGAQAFIKRQYTTLYIFVAGLALVILVVYGLGEGWGYAALMMVAYVVGSVLSGVAGIIGMRVGVSANSRTAQASTKGLAAAFNVSFFGGAVMGLLVTGLALFGVWAFYFFSGSPAVVLGYSFGASSIALFAKAGGGIYTKTADVGADLVGKIEYTMPEDDPRNPASVADNVGDNVGDIAGMGADLFDSYVASLVAAMLLCFGVYDGVDAKAAELFSSMPLITSAAGLIASIIGIALIKKLTTDNPGKTLNLGTWVATGLFIVISLGLSALLMLEAGDNAELAGRILKNWGAGAIGVGVGLVIGMTTDYYTDDSKYPTQATAESAQQGHALTILTGFSYGLYSVAAPIIGIVVVMALAYLLDGVWGVANSAVGMLAIVGTIVSNDAFGPITDNARGIAEQGGLGEEFIRICDKLDSAGNTAKAVTKGFAIGAAALTVLALLYSYSHEAAKAIGVGLNLDLQNPEVMIGALIGAIVPPVYSGILIMAVQRNAQLMVKEIRRQFTEHPEILNGGAKADYASCVDIATKGALKELAVPVAIAIGAPIATGAIFGVNALGAFLASSILTGLVFALLMSNAGGTWDNAKKYIEDGHFGGKSTSEHPNLAHQAAVTGDTVGDPFKDTAGPSINTLICVMSLTASMFLALFVLLNDGAGWIVF